MDTSYRIPKPCFSQSHLTGASGQGAVDASIVPHLSRYYPLVQGSRFSLARYTGRGTFILNRCSFVTN